jgi:hypothetical protein
MQNLKKLARLMLSEESGSYNDAFKAKFRLVGKKAMKELGRLLELRTFDIQFNPGGIAVSGDLRLMGMWSEGNGVYISMNKDFPSAPYGQILYRTIKHMKDFTGGPNQWPRYETLRDPVRLKELICRLRSLSERARFLEGGRPAVNVSSDSLPGCKDR